VSLYDYRIVSGCRYCGYSESWHGISLDHSGYAPPTMDHLLIRMRYRAIRRELRQLMDQLPKGAKRGRL
jgi:hypothetical protein